MSSSNASNTPKRPSSATERRRLQNRNAQRSYRSGLKNRIKALEDTNSALLALQPYYTSVQDATESSDDSPQSTVFYSPQLSSSQHSAHSSEFQEAEFNYDLSLSFSSIDNAFSTTAQPAQPEVSNVSGQLELQTADRITGPICQQLYPGPLAVLPAARDMNEEEVDSRSMNLSQSQSQITKSRTNVASHHQISTPESMDYELMEGMDAASWAWLRENVPAERPSSSRRPSSQYVSTTSSPYQGHFTPQWSKHYRRSPLHIAVTHAQTACTRLFLANGADPNVCDENGCTPLHTCAKNGNTEILKLLIEYGAMLELYDRDGYTPLQIAARTGAEGVVEALLNAGARL